MGWDAKPTASELSDQSFGASATRRLTTFGYTPLSARKDDGEGNSGTDRSATGKSLAGKGAVGISSMQPGVGSRSSGAQPQSSPALGKRSAVPATGKGGVRPGASPMGGHSGSETVVSPPPLSQLASRSEPGSGGSLLGSLGSLGSLGRHGAMFGAKSVAPKQQQQAAPQTQMHEPSMEVGGFLSTLPVPLSLFTKNPILAKLQTQVFCFFHF